MSLVRCGEVIIGQIEHIPLTGEFYAWREDAKDGMVKVGTSSSKKGALTLIGRSLVYSATNPRQMSPAIRGQLQEALNMLRGLGFDPIAGLIADAMKEQ